MPMVTYTDGSIAAGGPFYCDVLLVPASGAGAAITHPPPPLRPLYDPNYWPTEQQLIYFTS